MYRALAIGWLILVVLALGGCGGTKSNPAAQASTNTTAGTGASNESGAGGTGDTTKTGSVTKPGCGNGVKEGAEECDDGNNDDTDGCTSTCEYTCHKTADCTSDVCAGSNPTCDPNTHKCLVSPDSKADGTKCGDNKSCQKGKCVAAACGNTFKEGTEECDDGNQDDFDGCTTACKYTCKTGAATRNCANDCDLTSTCDDATHTCKAGALRLADNTLCKSGAGYCAKGQCITAVCGDGVQQPNEECDKGDANGTTAAGCTKTCTLAVCGNGKIEGKEQCDDGNTTNLDGCDSGCKIELAYRGARMRPSQDPAPDFCVYAKNAKSGNAFGQMMKNTDLLGNLNSTMDSMMENSPMAFMFHILDVDDATFSSADSLVRIGQSVGVPADAGVGQDGLDWANSTKKLDFPVEIYHQFYDKQLEPIAISYAKITIENGKAVVATTKPLTMGFNITGGNYNYMDAGFTLPKGKFIMRDLMMRLEVDAPRSKITPPLQTADIKVPESAGNYDPTGNTGATGIMCGALDPSIFSQIGVPIASIGAFSIDFTVVCSDQWGKITACQQGQDPTKGECSSMLDFLKLGCSSPLGVAIAPLGDPDADTDGDGKPDSYTMVARIATQRIKISGYASSQPPGEPIPPQ